MKKGYSIKPIYTIVETKENAIEVLNDLMELNNDHIVGDAKAIDETKTEDSDHKAIFAQMTQQSR